MHRDKDEWVGLGCVWLSAVQNRAHKASSQSCATQRGIKFRIAYSFYLLLNNAVLLPIPFS